MSQGGSFQLIQTLRRSPAVFRRKLYRSRMEDLSHGDPLFKVHYLGTEKIYSLDMEQAQGALSQLLSKAPEKLSKDHALVVRPRYVEVKEISTGRQLTKTYLRDIAFCAADREQPNVFLYICRLQGQQLQCRVFWCRNAERAKDIASCLAHSFQTALNDWHEGGANHTLRNEPERNGQSVVPKLHLKTSNPLPDVRKGRQRKRAQVSYGPLRAMRRKTRTDNTSQSNED